MVVGDVDAAVGAFGQRFLDGLLGALRAHRNSDHFAAVFFFQAQRFFERVAIGLVRFEADVGFANPCAAFGDGERRIFRGNLLDANADFQESSMNVRWQMALSKFAGRHAVPLARALGLLFVPALEEQRGVGAAEAERIRERVFDFRFARLVRNVIEIARRIGIFVVDRRRQNLIAQRQHADARFEAARAAEQMARSWISSS